MSLLLLKALAVALTLSQILTQPEVKTSFQPVKDRAQVRKILREGCTHIRTVLAEEVPAFKKMDPEKFLDMMIQNAETLGQSTELLPGIQMKDAKTAYQVFCVDTQPTADSDRILDEVVGFYNLTMYELPDVSHLANLKLSEYSVVRDVNGEKLTDMFRSSRREFVPYAQIPERLRNAFISAEDSNFFQHRGVDERGVVRAGMRNLMGGGDKREQGGSTITQQLIKNLVLTNEVTYERKMREMVLAYRLEKLVSKERILELYMNYVLLGCSSWGVSMGAKCYFGKEMSQLSVAQAAFLAGMPKGPSIFNPDRNPEGSQKRTQYVLKQMLTNKKIVQEEYDAALKEVATMKREPYQSPAIGNAGYFLDELAFQVKRDFGMDPRENAMEIDSTLNPKIQAAAEEAVQEGLVQFELRMKRAEFSGPEDNVTEAIEKAKTAGDTTPWLTALKNFNTTATDVKWPTAVVVEAGKTVKVGLRDEQIYNLKTTIGNTAIKGASNLKVGDIVFVTNVTPGKKNPTAELRYRPQVQGAALVMENKTGRILAMVGGFSHPLSTYNRAVNMLRQPGSTAKPLVYLAALQRGLQPNTIIWDSPVKISPLPGYNRTWRPDNYESKNGSETVTMRKGLEDSRNRVAARLAAGMANTEAEGLDLILNVMKDCGFNDKPQRIWPVILGSQETTMVKIATCYAAIANGGARPTPHLVRRISKNGELIFDESQLNPIPMHTADAASAYQLRVMMQGVIERGTAAGLKKRVSLVSKDGTKQSLSSYVAGKTGTSQASNDAWFVGFGEDLTYAVWTGYDNASAKEKRTLGGGTGGTVSAPIFAEIFKSAAKNYPLRPFSEPSSEIANKIAPFAIQQGSGDIYEAQYASSQNMVLDYIRVNEYGQPYQTRDNMLNYQSPGYPYQNEQQYGSNDPYAQNYRQDPYYNNGNQGGYNDRYYNNGGYYDDQYVDEYNRYNQEPTW